MKPPHVLSENFRKRNLFARCAACEVLLQKFSELFKGSDNRIESLISLSIKNVDIYKEVLDYSEGYQQIFSVCLFDFMSSVIAKEADCVQTLS